MNGHVPVKAPRRTAERRRPTQQAVDVRGINYRIFINGILDPLGTPTGVGRTITYGVDDENTFVLRAVDSAGNVSAPSNAFRITLDDCI